MRECVQELGVVRDDQTSLPVIYEELRQVLDARLVQIVRRLIEEEDVRILDEGRGEEQASLLAAGEGFD